MSRVQLAINVENLEESIGFYATLFGTAPAKIKPGYANFTVLEPPMKLVLVENPGNGGSINHLGVEVGEVDTVRAELTRLHEAGFVSFEQHDTTCCYARQEKFWVQDAPDGERWEVYTVLSDSDALDGDAAEAGTACCDGGHATEGRRPALDPRATACC